MNLVYDDLGNLEGLMFRVLTVTTSALVMISAASVGYAAERAGETTRVQPNSYQGDGFFPDFLETGDEIFRQEKVYTEEYGSMEIRFDDGSNLTLGPSTEIVVDNYVYNPSDSSGASALSLGRGVLRFISGQLPSDSIGVSTSIATIGVRGTDFTLDTNTFGSLKVWVDEGIVAVSPLQSDQTFEFTAPAYAVCTVTTCEGTDPPSARPVVFPIAPNEPEEREDGGGGGGGGGD